MTPTEELIRRLSSLKTGDLGILRTHANQRLDETLEGFDLFTGLWWPLRQKNQRAPRREVAWLVTKLYAWCPLEHQNDFLFARELRRCEPHTDPTRFRLRFDGILLLPLSQIEPSLQWALNTIAAGSRKTLDWRWLVDDLSAWEKPNTQQKWAEQYLANTKGNGNAY